VLEAIERAGQGRMAAVRMERFTADDRPTVDVCRNRAADCDLFLGIVAHRYGWEPSGQKLGEEKSVTWLEYEAARAAGRPCLMFEIDPSVRFTRADMDREPEKLGKLERFKALYAKDQLPALFQDENLGMVVQQALYEWMERTEKKQASSRDEVLERLGAGGMAEVWRVRRTRADGFQHELVLKRIHPRRANDPELIRLLRNEAKIAARFHHPNIVQVYDFQKDERGYFIAMEYVAGRDLGRVMRKTKAAGKRISLRIGARIAALICEGLHYAHGMTDDSGRPLNVVHRDVSPRNILVGFNGSVKLTDFGVAKVARSTVITEPGKIKGKVAYMSPEQSRGAQIDFRADIFAVGLMLYELVTGFNPLDKGDSRKTLEAVRKCEITPPSRVANVPPELDPIVMRALAMRPDDRYEHARQFAEALERFLVVRQWQVGSAQISELLAALVGVQSVQDVDEQPSATASQTQRVGRAAAMQAEPPSRRPSEPRKVAPTRDVATQDVPTEVVSVNEESTVTQDVPAVPIALVRKPSKPKGAVPSKGTNAVTEEVPTTVEARLRAANEANVIPRVEVTQNGGVELVYIAEGDFMMGAPSDEEGRFAWEDLPGELIVPPFWIGRYLVTNEQYGRFLAEHPGVRPPACWTNPGFNRPLHPVVGVTWHEAMEFARWAGGTLPTESQWEYACRAGTTGPRYEEDLDTIAWYGEKGGDKTHPVGQKKPNRLGLYDMLGNVWEWCHDDRGSGRVVRGGSCRSGAREVRAACRDWYGPNYRSSFLGFRLGRARLA